MSEKNQQQAAISSFSGEVLLISLSGEQVTICKIYFDKGDSGDSQQTPAGAAQPNTARATDV